MPALPKKVAHAVRLTQSRSLSVTTGAHPSPENEGDAHVPKDALVGKLTYSEVLRNVVRDRYFGMVSDKKHTLQQRLVTESSPRSPVVGGAAGPSIDAVPVVIDLELEEVSSPVSLCDIPPLENASPVETVQPDILTHQAHGEESGGDTSESQDTDQDEPEDVSRGVNAMKERRTIQELVKRLYDGELVMSYGSQPLSNLLLMRILAQRLHQRTVDYLMAYRKNALGVSRPNTYPWTLMKRNAFIPSHYTDCRNDETWVAHLERGGLCFSSATFHDTVRRQRESGNLILTPAKEEIRTRPKKRVKTGDQQPSVHGWLTKQSNTVSIENDSDDGAVDEDQAEIADTLRMARRRLDHRSRNIRIASPSCNSAEDSPSASSHPHPLPSISARIEPNSSRPTNIHRKRKTADHKKKQSDDYTDLLNDSIQTIAKRA